MTSDRNKTCVTRLDKEIVLLGPERSYLSIYKCYISLTSFEQHFAKLLTVMIRRKNSEKDKNFRILVGF